MTEKIEVYCTGRGRTRFETTSHEEMTIHLWESYVRKKYVKAKEVQ